MEEASASSICVALCLRRLPVGTARPYRETASGIDGVDV